MDRGQSLPGRVAPDRTAPDRAAQRRRASGRPRIEDVAALAGTSAITVSRTLRAPAKVTEATRGRVLRAIEQLGYIPDIAASSLASRRTGIIAVLVPTITIPVFAETVQGITDTVRAEGLQILLGDYNYSDASERELLLALAGRRPEAIISVGLVQEPAARALLRGLGVPVVESWDLTDDALDLVVGFSHAGAGGAMARHLAAGGGRRLAFVGGTDRRAAARAAGFVAAAIECGVSAAIALPTAASNLAEGARALAQVIEQAPQTDAVFLSDDMLAAGALLECQRRGLAVPDRIAIAGLGNMEISRALSPGITTIDVAAREIGRRAAQAVLARRRGEATGPAVHDLGFSLIPRGSTRSVPAVA